MPSAAAQLRCAFGLRCFGGAPNAIEEEERRSSAAEMSIADNQAWHDVCEVDFAQQPPIMMKHPDLEKHPHPQLENNEEEEEQQQQQHPQPPPPLPEEQRQQQPVVFTRAQHRALAHVRNAAILSSAEARPRLEVRTMMDEFSHSSMLHATTPPLASVSRIYALHVC